MVQCRSSIAGKSSHQDKTVNLHPPIPTGLSIYHINNNVKMQPLRTLEDNYITLPTRNIR